MWGEIHYLKRSIDTDLVSLVPDQSITDEMAPFDLPTPDEMIATHEEIEEQYNLKYWDPG